MEDEAETTDEEYERYLIDQLKCDIDDQKREFFETELRDVRQEISLTKRKIEFFETELSDTRQKISLTKRKIEFFEAELSDTRQKKLV